MPYINHPDYGNSLRRDLRATADRLVADAASFTLTPEQARAIEASPYTRRDLQLAMQAHLHDCLCEGKLGLPWAYAETRRAQAWDICYPEILDIADREYRAALALQVAA